ncbi:MAG: OmpA family protein [Gammaproteobacteria bacterium]|jgi:sodium-type flagellar protein MotY|nr:OmpA family protein [Gammaproteobacteria bacterium]
MKINQILLLGLLLAATDSQARMNIRQYAATIEQSNWTVPTATALKCELSHNIPNFGEARFSSNANKELNLLFELNMTRLPDDYGLAKVLSVPPQWRAGEIAKPITDLALLKQFNGGLPKKAAWTLLTELEQGFSPTFFFADWHSPFDQVAAAINPVHFNDPFQKFNLCMAGLLRFTFEDIAMTVLNYQSNSDELTRESQARLAQIAEYLKHDKALASVTIDTYTDSYGGRWINEELSRKRAATLKAFFVNAGVDAKLVKTEGFGEKRHVAPNETTRGRGTNRRAVVQLAKL